MKSYLFVLQKPPHSGAYAQEMLDIILTTAAFDQAVSILLLDDGVFQLKKGQRPEIAGMKDTAAMESLQERGLTPDDLSLPVQALHRKEIAGLMQRFDVVFSG